MILTVTDLLNGKRPVTIKRSGRQSVTTYRLADDEYLKGVGSDRIVAGPTDTVAIFRDPEGLWVHVSEERQV